MIVKKKKIQWAVWGLCAGALLAGGAAVAQNASGADSAGAVAPADAAPAKAKPAAKPKKAAPPSVAVVVSNGRNVALSELSVAAAGSPDSKKVAGPLAPGKKVTVHLAHDKACLFDVHAVFEDGANSDEQGVELCKDKKINLVE